MSPNNLASDRGEQDTQNSVLLTQRPNFNYWVFGALAIGICTSVVDHGSVNVALPTIASEFKTDLPTIQWVVII